MQNFGQIPEIGFLFLVLLSLLSFLRQPLFSFVINKSKYLTTLSKAHAASLFIFAIISLFCLIYCYIISDFSVLNVYLNSNSLKPLIYKISASWGNHEGSLLLLLVIMCFYNLVFTFFARIDQQRKNIAINTQNLIIFLIAIFTILVSSPFERISPVPADGMGLKPILQDVGLALHPPMLYIGYFGSSIIFSLAISALIKKKIDKSFAIEIHPWVMFSWSFLTLGIGLGSWWAYRELGWGGYWFWDPVENVSLMPWLVMTALFHSNIILKKTGQLNLWVAFLSILAFTMGLIGVFLVRSGLVTSVHAFASDPSRGVFIIAILLIISGGGFLTFFVQSFKFKNRQQDFSFFSHPIFILLNNVILCAILLIVFLGTIYPMLHEFLFGGITSMGLNYYISLINPLALLLLLLMIFVPFLHYFSYKDFKENLQNNLGRWLVNIFIFTSILIYILTKIEDDKVNFLTIFIISVCIILFLSNFYILKFGKYFLKNNLKKLPLFLGHLGLVLIIFGISWVSLFSIKKEFLLKKGGEKAFLDYVIKFKDIKYQAGKNFISRVGVFEVRKSEQSYIIKPETRYYPVSDKTTTEVGIKSSFIGDLYLVMGFADDNENYAIRFHHKPLIYLIWLGCLIMFAGGIVAFSLKNRNPSN
jgi:cytochrome c-type biogenesis protein CcmF